MLATDVWRPGSNAPALKTTDHATSDSKSVWGGSAGRGRLALQTGGLVCTDAHYVPTGAGTKAPRPRARPTRALHLLDFLRVHGSRSCSGRWPRSGRAQDGSGSWV